MIRAYLGKKSTLDVALWIEYFRHAELVSASLKPWVSISVRRM